MGKLDDTIRNKVLRAKPYHPHPNWERMEALLDQEDDTAVGGFWQQSSKWLIGGFLLLLLGSGLGWWMFSPQAEMVGIQSRELSHAEMDTACVPADVSHIVFPPPPSISSTQPSSSHISSPAHSLPSTPSSSTNPGLIGRKNKSASALYPVTAISTTKRSPSEHDSLLTDQQDQLEMSRSLLIDEAGKEELTTSNLQDSRRDLPRVQQLAEHQFIDLATLHPKSLPSLAVLAEEPKPSMDLALEEMSLKQRLGRAFGSGQNKWAQSNWAAQGGITASSFTLQVLADSSLRRFNVVMPGVGVGVFRKVSPRWDLGGRVDFGSFYKIYPASVFIVRNVLGQPLTSGSGYVFASGKAQDISSQARFQFVKNGYRRFRPYWIAGAGLHFLQANLEGVEFSSSYIANPSADIHSVSFSTFEDGYVRNYQNSFNTRNSEIDTASASSSFVLREHKVIRGMLYTGAGVDIRLHRRVSLTYQLSVHVNVRYNPAIEVGRLIQEDLALNSADSPDPLVGQRLPDENWTPPYLRQFLGLKIAL
ncbi:MAG: hypothetical protein AAF587_10690 [Bacteroidota bacterium]